MLLIDDLTLLSRNDDGSPRIHDLVLDRLLAAAALIDLRLAGGMAHSSDDALLRLVEPRTEFDPVLSALLGQARQAATGDPAELIKALDHHLGKTTRGRLTEAGRLVAVNIKRLGIFKNLIWRPADPAAQAALVERVRAARGSDDPPSGTVQERDAALVGLLAAGGVLTEIDTAARPLNAGGDPGINVADPAHAAVLEAVRRLVRRRRFAVAAGASAGGTTGAISG